MPIGVAPPKVMMPVPLSASAMNFSPNPYVSQLQPELVNSCFRSSAARRLVYV
jgi:hypothetical protein